MTMPNSRPPVVSLSFERFRALPIRPNVWQLGLVRLSAWTDEKVGWPYRSLVALCRSATGGPSGKSDAFFPRFPVGSPALEAVANLALQPGMGYRPQQIEISDSRLADAVRDRLADCGIEVVAAARLEQFEEASARIRRRRSGIPTGAPCFDPAVGIGVMRAFAEAAADYHRAQLWHHLTEHDHVEVVSPAAPRGMSHFQMFGGGGKPRGLMFFPSAERREKFMRDREQDWLDAHLFLWHMAFLDVVRVPLADSELWETHELPVAARDAHPILEQPQPRASQPPAREHLEFAEVLLRALAVTTEADLDSGRWSKQVRTRSGRQTVELLLPATADARVPAAAADIIERAVLSTGRLRIKLAREAARRWPDCSSAYLLQVDAMPDITRRAELCRLAFEASDRTLGPDGVREFGRAAWPTPESRRYFQARRELAECCWHLGRRDEAIAHWFALLRLDPHDTRRVREILVPRLIAAFEEEDVTSLLLEYQNDPSAILAYARALHVYDLVGETPEARRLLHEAIRRNGHAPALIAKREDPPGPFREDAPAGSEDEARLIAHLLGPVWGLSPGAREWLAEEVRRLKGARSRKPAALPGAPGA